MEHTQEDQNAQTVTIEIDGKNTTYRMSDIKNIEKVAAMAPPPPAPAATSAQSGSASTIPAGTVMHTTMTTELTTKKHKTGHQFKAKLESSLFVNGGKSSMVIGITAITVNNKRIPIESNKINAVAETGQGANTAKKTAGAAAIGGLVDGSSGAKTGAKVGLGAAILSPGQAIRLAPGTMLDFTIIANVKL
jgi:hypothetical protein